MNAISMWYIFCCSNRETSMGYFGLRKYSILYNVVYRDLILEQLQCDDKSNRNVKKMNCRHYERRTQCIRSKIAFCRRDELDATHPC